MAVFTFIYVVATICISIFNKKSADASRQQMEVLQKQQEQNVGLQLYNMRKQVVRRISNKEYNEVFWEVPLLFNDELFADFQKIAFKDGRVKEIQKIIDDFEIDYELIAGSQACMSIKSAREKLTANDDANVLSPIILQGFQGKDIGNDMSIKIDEYIKNIIEMKRENYRRGSDSFELIMKMNDFIKASIQ